jgi:hypothetical protein
VQERTLGSGTNSFEVNPKVWAIPSMAQPLSLSLPGLIQSRQMRQTRGEPTCDMRLSVVLRPVHLRQIAEDGDDAQASFAADT